MRCAASGAPGEPEPAGDADSDADSVEAVELRRLRWRARRGLLENDLLLRRFFERHAAALGAGARAALACLLELPDGELLDLILGRAAPSGELDRPAVQDLLALLRAS